MFRYGEELRDYCFTDKEMENMFKKFNRENIEVFNLISYFSSFDPEIEEIVERLKQKKEEAYNSKDITPKVRIENEINRLSTRELEFLGTLLNISEFCASSDDRYIAEARYLDYLRTISERALSRKTKKKHLAL